MAILDIADIRWRGGVVVELREEEEQEGSSICNNVNLLIKDDYVVKMVNWFWLLLWSLR